MKRNQVLVCGLLIAVSLISAAQSLTVPHQPVAGPVAASSRPAPNQAAIEHRFLKPDALPLPGVPGVIPGSKAVEAHRLRAATMARPAEGIAAPSISFTQAMPGLEMRPFLNAGSYPSAVATGDFDRDGHLDFVVSNAGSSDLWLYRGNGDNTFKTPQVIPLTKGSNPVYVAAADLRGSGNLDLVVAEYGSFSVGVLLNKGDGTFAIEQEYTLPDPPGAITIADFNHDGKLDIVIGLMTLDVNLATGAIPWIAMLAGNGDGTFQDATITSYFGAYAEASDIDSADVNGDGLPDLLITNPNLLQATIFLNNGDGTFSQGQDLLEPGENLGPIDGRLGDLNGDGCPDAAVSELMEFVVIKFGDCAGHFSSPAYIDIPEAATAMRLADVNGDGHLDIVASSIVYVNMVLVYTAGNTIAVLPGDGKGNFGTPHVYNGNSESLFLALGDFKGNGFPSVVTADSDSDTVSLYFNDGMGDLGFPEGGVPTQLPLIDILAGVGYDGYTFADLNKDGKPDMFRAAVYDNQNASLVSLNDGSGHFGTEKVFPVGLGMSGAFLRDYRLGDFRNTGDLDLIMPAGQSLLFQPGNGDGTFGQGKVLSNLGPQNALVVSTGDFNKDGKLDFVVAGTDANNNHTLIPYMGNGDGTFQTGIPVQFSDQNETISRIFTGDYNRDGKLDVLVFTTSNGYWTPYSAVWEFFGNGDGTFQAGKQLYSGFQPMTMADLNGDGWPDIVRYDFMWPDGTTETDAPPKFTNYLGQPDGTFAQVSSYSPYTGYPQSPTPFEESGDPLNGYIVGDFNGDGKVDEAAILRPPGPLTAAFLAGNGDGTFVPTYDYFPFSTYYFPLWQHDLTGDGFSDMVQVDYGTNAVTMYRGAPAPVFQMALESTEVSDGGCGYVWPNLVASSDRSIALTSSAAGVTLPSTVDLPAGSTVAKFCFRLAANYDLRQAYAITATLDGQSETVYGAATYTRGFTESLSTKESTPVYLGQSSPPITVTITAQPGYTGTVQLGCAELQPKWSCQFTPSDLSLTPGATATASLVVTSDASEPSLNNPIYVTAGDGTDAQMQPLMVDMVQLQIWPMGPTPTLWDASPGTTTTTTFAYNAAGTHTMSCSGLPAGAACTFVDTPGTNLTDMSVTLPAGVPAGTIPFNVNIASETYSASTPATLQVFSINLGAPAAGSAQGLAGNQVQLTFPVQVGNVPAYNALSLSCTMDGVNCSITPYAGVDSTTAQLTLSIGVPSSMQPGTHQLAITTTVMGFVRTFQSSFNVVDFSGSLNATSVTLNPGGSGSVTVTITPAGGATGNVQLSCSSSAASSALMLCFFSPAAVQLVSGGAQSTLTISAGMAARSGEAPFTFGGYLTFAVLLPIGLIGFRSRRHFFIICLMLLVLFPLFSCGGGSGTGGSGGGSNPPTTYTVKVSGSVGAATRDMGAIAVTVKH